MAPSDRRVRAGVVGVGHMGQYHARVYAELWDVDLVGITDLNGDRAREAAAHYDTVAFADHRDLIGRVDVADVANVQIWFDSGTIATITASRATEEKIRTLAITQPDAYIVLDYLVQDIQIHRRAAQESQPNRESIRYRQASFVEHLFVHKDNPLKLEILHLVGAVRRARSGAPLELAETENLRSLAMALEIERMIRDGRCESAWPGDLPWSARSQ